VFDSLQETGMEKKQENVEKFTPTVTFVPTVKKTNSQKNEI